MAIFKNFGLTGVGGDVQFGKGGARLLQQGGIFQLRNSTNDAFARLEVAATTGTMSENTVTSKGYVDGLIAALQGELDTSQTAVGLEASGSLPAWGTTNYLSGATTIRGGILALDSALASINTALQTADGSLASRIQTVEGSLSSVEGRLTTAEGSISNLGGRLATAEGSLSALGTAVANLGSISTAQLQSELDLTQASVGLETSGSFVAPSGSYSAGATTVLGYVSAIDAALAAVDANLSVVETAAGLGTNGSLAPFAGPSFLASAVTLKSGIETVGSFALAVDTNLSAVEASVGLGADGSLVAFSGTMIGGATTVVGAITALRDAVDGRLDDAESELTRLNTTLTTSYIHRDGSVAMTGSFNAGGFAIHSLPVQSPSDTNIPNTDAASVGFVRGQISNLAGAFQYEGTINLGSIAAEAAILPASYDTGSYLKVATAGYFTFTGSGTAIYANHNDGLVKNSVGGWDKIDNTDSTVDGTPNFIAVSGSPDFGYVVDIATTFKDRMTNVEASVTSVFTYAEGSLTALTSFTTGSLAALTTEVGRVNGSLESRLGSAEARITTAEGSLSYLGTWAAGSLAALGSYDGVVAGSLAALGSMLADLGTISTAQIQSELDLTQASVGLQASGSLPAITATYAAGATTVIDLITNVATGLDGSLGALTTFVNGSLSALTSTMNAQFTAVQAELDLSQASVGLLASGSLPAFTGSYVSAASTVVGAINSLADTVGSLNLAEITARSAADASLQAELDETQVLLGLTGTSGTALPTLVWGTAAPSYVQATTSIRGAIEAVSTSLANLSQDTIRNGTDTVRVNAGTSAVTMSVPGSGGSLTQAVEIVGGASMNAALQVDFGTANEVRFEATGGAGGNTSIRFVPSGTGQVFIGDTGVAGAVQADTGQDLIVSGGDSGAGAGGDLLLRGGNGNTANNDGRVVIEGSNAAGDAHLPVAMFASAPAAAYFDFGVGSTAVTIAAAGASIADVILTPAGSGVISASSARIANVAAPTTGTDAVNRDFMNAAIAASATSVSTGAVRTVTGTVTADGTVTLGTITGTVLRVKVAITSAFTAGSLTVGHSGNTAQVASNDDVDLTQTGLYVVENAHDYSSAVVLATSSGMSGSGTARVIVEYLQG